MDPTLWAAVSALAGVFALTGTLVIHMLKAAEEKGHSRARIEALEKAQNELNAANKVLPKLEATLETLARVVERTDQTLTGIMQGQIQLPQPRRRQAAA